MTGTHRLPEKTTRRAVLGLAAAAAVSGVGLGVHQWLSARRPSAGGPVDGGPSGGAPVGGPGAADSASPPGRGRPAAPGSPLPAVSDGALGGGPVRFQPGKVMLGAYLGLSGMTLAQSLALRRRQLGRDERILHVFYGWGDTLPTTIAGRPAGGVPMVSWRGTTYDDILGGSSDRLIAAAARNLAKLKVPTFLRWGWEMNGNWYPWGGSQNGDDPAGYVDCWRHIHKIFQVERVDNISWVWSANWNSKPATYANRFQAYYPGDSYVDWVGISGYNLHDEAPATLYDPLYQAYAARKPLFITECGAVDRGGTTKGDWVRAFTQYVQQRPAIGAVTWFDTDTHKDAPTNWRIDTNPDALAAYQAMAGSPRFAG